jgi:hypothetical protein
MSLDSAHYRSMINSGALVRQRNILTERLPLVSEVGKVCRMINRAKKGGGGGGVCKLYENLRW